jgi:hypothetical protein
MSCPFRATTKAQLAPIQQTILVVVHTYPGQFSRSGLAKMLVGAKSWEDDVLQKQKGFCIIGRHLLQ